MRFYSRQHQHYCGIDLHVKTMYVCVLSATGDVLRRRLHLVRKRGQLLAHIQMMREQYNLLPFERRLAYPANRDGVGAHFPIRACGPPCSSCGIPARHACKKTAHAGKSSTASERRFRSWRTSLDARCSAC